METMRLWRFLINNVKYILKNLVFMHFDNVVIDVIVKKNEDEVDVDILKCINGRT